MTRVLFVHDDPRACDRAHRFIAQREPGWEFRAAVNVADAWKQAESWQPHAVVALAHGPGFDGIELLARLHHTQPATVRIALGVDKDSEDGLRALRIAHRALVEPVDPAALLETLRRLLLLSDLVAKPGVREMLGRIGSLPAVPSVYSELVRRLEDPNTSVYSLGELVSSDATLAAQVLRIANSAYFGRHQPVTRIESAAARLGTRLLRSLVLTAEIYGRFPVSPFMAERLEAMQAHASLVARLASSLEPAAPWKDDAFTAGLLHDVGKLLLSSHLPDAHASIVRESEQSYRPEYVVEVQRMGVHHGTLAACLLGMWGLPRVVLEAAHVHHEPLEKLPSPLTPVLAVTVANQLAHHVSAADGEQVNLVHLPAAVLSDPRWNGWCELASQYGRPEAEAA